MGSDGEHDATSRSSSPQSSPSPSGSGSGSSDEEEEPPVKSRSPTPVPEGQYEVEHIINYVKDDSGHMYFVKWKNWEEEFNTWEPPENLLQCEVALTKFFLERRKEMNDILEKSEYVETSDGKRRRRGPPMKKLQLPPDPRPITIIAEEFYELNSQPTEAEVKEWEAKWRAKKLAQKVNPKKKTTNSSFVWAFSRISRVLQDGINGKLSPPEILTLRSQLLYYDFDRRHAIATDALKKWEKQINNLSMGNPIIKVENLVDLEGPPEGFSYINDYVPGPGISIPDDPPVGCNCKGTCYESRTSCCAVQFGSTFAYTPHGKLRVPVGTPIYECNSKCGCGQDCPNRVVQHGSTKLRLAIYRTASGMGWGVKTIKNIKRGSFVSLYVGEVIRTEEAERRGREYDAEGCTYLFDLDFNEGDACPFTVDAAKYGNIAHFINHSCDPNLAVFSVWVNCLDPNLPKLALFAIKDIAHGEELFFDYKNDANKDGRWNLESSQAVAKKPCLCGTKKCRKYLF